MLLTLAVSLVALAPAATQARKPEPARPPLVLEGVWVGEEVGAVGARHPTITFTGDGGTLAYEDTSGGTGSFTMRLQAVKVEGAQVRFSVPGGGKLRLWSGRWDGHKISGTIAPDASGAPQIGTFELRRPVYEDAPRSRSSGASSQTAPEPASSEPGSESARAEGTPATSQIEREREAGKQRLEKRLSQISDQASQLLVSIGEWQASCHAGGTPLYDQPAVDCDGMIREIGRLGIAVGRGLEEAEDEARRSWVEPGTVRELRAEYGLESSKWDELSSKIRQAEAEWAQRKH
jgi:hypothetical protein